MKTNADLLDEANERTKDVVGSSGETEKALRELGKAKLKLANAFSESSLGKFVIWCVEQLNALLKKFGEREGVK